jgi:hypothetical protein
MDTLSTLSLEAAPAKVRLKAGYRGNATGGNFYAAGAVVDYGPEAHAYLIAQGVAEPAPADAALSDFIEDANGLPFRRPRPAPTPRPAPVVRPPEPEDEGPIGRMIIAIKADKAIMAERQAQADALPARLADLEQRVKALEDKVNQ